jgi:NADPH:quinone reductase-like Zn-dependent oxidoreductase
VIGRAGEANHEWLRRHDLVPVTYGDGQLERIRNAANGSAEGSLEIPIAATYPLDSVREAFGELADRHTHGKVVLLPEA